MSHYMIFSIGIFVGIFITLFGIGIAQIIAHGMGEKALGNVTFWCEWCGYRCGGVLISGKRCPRCNTEMKWERVGRV